MRRRQDRSGLVFLVVVTPGATALPTTLRRSRRGLRRSGLLFPVFPLLRLLRTALAAGILPGLGGVHRRREAARIEGRCRVVEATARGTTTIIIGPRRASGTRRPAARTGIAREAAVGTAARANDLGRRTRAIGPRRSTSRTTGPAGAARTTGSTGAARTTTVLGLVDADGAAVDEGAVHLVDGGPGVLCLGKADEAEASASTGLPIQDHTRFDHFSMWLESGPETLIIGTPAQTSHEQLDAHLLDPLTLLRFRRFV